MKKFILPILCCLIATSCLKESTFTATNYVDFVTSYEGKLYSDYYSGVAFTVKENKTGTSAWKKDGARFVIECDILNRAMEIRLNKLTEVSIQKAKAYLETENEADDPVVIANNNIGGGYLNLAVDYYADPASDCAHDIQFFYQANDDHSEVSIHVLHSGNHENPVYMDEKKLEVRERIYSIPLEDFVKKGTPCQPSLVLYDVMKDESGNLSIQKNTYPATGVINL